MRARTALSVIGIVIGSSAALGQESGPIVITEIMYNPSGTDDGQEWVEIYNPSPASVDLSGWYLQDNDGVTSPFAAGTALAPGSVAVISSRRGGVSGSGLNTRSTYVNAQASWDAAWGPGVQVIFVESFANYPADSPPVTGTLAGLSNSPSVTNENLRLVNAAGVVVDQVNYDDDEGEVTPWPNDDNSGSIQLMAEFVNSVADNNVGAAWRLSGAGDALASRLGGNALPAFPGLASYATPGLLPAPVFSDCNANGVNDAADIVHGTSPDVYPFNNTPDECESDCDGDLTPDASQILLDWRNDRNTNGRVDACEINAAGGSGGVGGGLDTNANGMLDSFENKPAVVITEIMYNPAGVDEGKEFVELYNTTNAAVDVSGWALRDIEGEDPSGAVPAGTLIAPHEAIVLIPGGGVGVPSDNEAQFRAAWNLGPAVRTFALNPWPARAQRATFINEVLAVIDVLGEPVDVADYENQEYAPQSAWPNDDEVSSVYLLAGAIDPASNDDGGSWRLSMSGLDGAYDSVQYGSFVDSRLTGSAGSPGVVWTSAAQTPTGDAVITEIMFNPNSNSGDNTRNEWIEVYNPGPSDLDLTGWYLRDEDGRTEGVPPGVLLPAGQLAVLLSRGSAPSAADAEADFRAAWGQVCTVVALGRWSDREPVPNLGNLSNSPDMGNEILTLRNGSGLVVDVVNFDDDGVVWPAGAAAAPPGLGTAWSVYLLPGQYTAASNDGGARWAASTPGVDLAFQNTNTPVFNGLDIASPGLLSGVVITPECPEAPCDLDYNVDGVPDQGDVATLMLVIAGMPNPSGLDPDFNHDGVPDQGDLSDLILSIAGAPCP